MISIYILIVGFIVVFSEMFFALKLLKNKNNELWLPLLFHSFVLIFVTVVLAFTDKKSFSETIPFILFVSIFYIFTLVWLCGVRIKQKKKNIDLENQKLYNDWK